MIIFIIIDICYRALSTLIIIQQNKLIFLKYRESLNKNIILYIYTLNWSVIGSVVFQRFPDLSHLKWAHDQSTSESESVLTHSRHVDTALVYISLESIWVLGVESQEQTSSSHLADPSLLLTDVV